MLWAAGFIYVCIQFKYSFQILCLIYVQETYVYVHLSNHYLKLMVTLFLLFIRYFFFIPVVLFKINLELDVWTYGVYMSKICIVIVL